VTRRTRALDAPAGTLARREEGELSFMSDTQWRNIVTHIAADYAKLGSEHKRYVVCGWTAQFTQPFNI